MIHSIITLFRPRLSLLNGISALSGYFLLPGSKDPFLGLIIFFGVSLLAAGGSVLNQVMERDRDALMTRTRLRPLPTGQVTPTAAICMGTGTALAALVMLGATGGTVPALCGAAALIWYLGVYTPLKSRTPFALPLGALSGAFPPLIGWCLAGGFPHDYRIIILSGLFFLWQIPHFWLLQDRNRADYLLAGIPLVDTGHGLLMLWIIALTVSALMLPLFGLIPPPTAIWFVAFLVLLLALSLTHTRELLRACLTMFPLILTCSLYRS